MTRNTRTGGVLEAMILPALDQGGYAHHQQQLVGQRLGGRKHVIDAIAEKDSKRFLISLKWQQTGGTAEQKVPFEVLSLADALVKGGFDGAYLVLGGEGWTLRDFYISGELEKQLVGVERVKILTLEAFVALANQGKL